ncbi:MAG: dihydrodipicolinate synthase family protein [Fimbriimonadaceae bacterium]|nr:dihydrodipicolinate synthase family protein [Fimbriimonadaceae bacterium]
MLGPGVYPASVTPFDEKGRIDNVAMAKLLAWFAAAGCRGVVLAGTNGEGPSLSAVEKRDLIRDAKPLAGNLELILGIATPSLDEAIWLSKRSEEFGASAVLVMPPYYFRTASEAGIRDWFMRFLDASPSPVLAYNFPRMTGITLSAELLGELGGHPQCAGLKDSSGDPGNLVPFRQAMPSEKVLFVGDERLLLDALRAGWTGTISGAANVVPEWLSVIVERWYGGAREDAEVKFEILAPVIEAIRSLSQPPANKAVLHRLGVLDRRTMRPPLTECPDGALEGLIALIQDRLGTKCGYPPDPSNAD